MSLHVMVIGLSGVHLQSVIIYSKWLTKSDDHKLKKYSNKSTYEWGQNASVFFNRHARMIKCLKV